MKETEAQSPSSPQGSDPRSQPAKLKCGWVPYSLGCTGPPGIIVSSARAASPTGLCRLCSCCLRVAFPPGPSSDHPLRSSQPLSSHDTADGCSEWMMDEWLLLPLGPLFLTPHPPSSWRGPGCTGHTEVGFGHQPEWAASALPLLGEGCHSGSHGKGGV